MKVLVTAFKPFNKSINNYSAEVLNYIDDVDNSVISINMEIIRASGRINPKIRRIFPGTLLRNFPKNTAAGGELTFCLR